MLISTPQNRDRQGAEFHTYLITFACYGSHLPGQPGIVDRDYSYYGGRFREPDSEKEVRVRSRMSQAPFQLDATSRTIVLEAIKEACSRRVWRLLAAHVRSNHVHVVIAANRSPEHVMSTLKSNASRALNNARIDTPYGLRWARYGSTRYLWTHEQISAAIHYVVCEQGEPMEVYAMPRASAP